MRTNANSFSPSPTPQPRKSALRILETPTLNAGMLLFWLETKPGVTLSVVGGDTLKVDGLRISRKLAKQIKQCELQIVTLLVNRDANE